MTATVRPGNSAVIVTGSVASATTATSGGGGGSAGGGELQATGTTRAMKRTACAVFVRRTTLRIATSEPSRTEPIALRDVGVQ